MVIRELEAIFSVSFRSWPTPGLYSAYDELADLSLDLDFDWTIETDFERVCPHVLNVDSMERER
ncbi:MAG TPA: hypothetical protein VFX61_01025 [Micromonosporaceae bacterium]|nr:hypothetical protein [Micromonosporaceae bacterium]